MGAHCGRILYQLDDFVASSSSESSSSKKRSTSLIGKSRPFALYDDRPLTRGQAIDVDDSADLPDEWGRHSSFSRVPDMAGIGARRGCATVQVSPHKTIDSNEVDEGEMAAKILQDFLDGHFANADGDEDFLGLSGRSTGSTARKTLTASAPKRGPSTHTLRSSIDNESERAYISPSLL